MVPLDSMSCGTEVTYHISSHAAMLCIMYIVVVYVVHGPCGQHVLGNGDNISYAQSYSCVSSYMAVLYVVHGPCGQHVLGNGDNTSYAQSYSYVSSYMAVVYVVHGPCGQHVLGNGGNISYIEPYSCYVYSSSKVWSMVIL